MAASQAKTNLAPEQVGLGQLILSQDATAISQLVNWIFGKRRQSHLALTLADDGWGTLGVGTLRAVLTGSAQTFVDTDARFDADALAHTFTFSAEVSTLAVGHTASVTITVDGDLGTATQTLSFTSADTTERRVTFGLSSAVSPDSWCRVRISGSKTGAGTYSILEAELEEDEKTSSLPDPENS